MAWPDDDEPNYVVMSNEELGDCIRALHKDNKRLQEIAELHQQLIEASMASIKELKEKL